MVLNLPAIYCGESPTVKENIFCVRSLTPQQATGNALAVQFTQLPYIGYFSKMANQIVVLMF